VFPVSKENVYEVMETLFKKAETGVAVSPASRNTNKFTRLVANAFEGENKPQGYDGTVAYVIWGGFARMSKTRHTWRRATLKELLLHLYSERCFRVLRSSDYIDVLVNISMFSKQMVRPIQDWKRPSFSPDEQLEDLIDHCFATYPTPVFLVTAFYGGSLSRMSWYVKLGQGTSVKNLLGFPGNFTAKMSHTFRNTPRGFDVAQALVRAEAIGFGASTTVAETLAYTRLVELEGNKKFWSEVIQFFAKAENKNLNDFRVLIDFLEFSVGRNRAFSLKGRTFDALTRDAIAWSVDTAKMNAASSAMMWYPSGIPAFDTSKDQDGKTVRYFSVELLSADDLYEEGEAMNHCVGEYVDACNSGASAIFSLRKIENGVVKRLATVEIDPDTLEVEEVSANCNAALSNEAFSILQTWCKEAGVKGWWDHPTPQPVRIARGDPPAAVRDLEIPWTTIFWLTWILLRVLWAFN